VISNNETTKTEMNYPQNHEQSPRQAGALDGMFFIGYHLIVGIMVSHRRNLDACGTSMSRTLRAAKPCKSAVLPICPGNPCLNDSVV